MRLESVLSECLLQWELILHHHFSGECNPVNWLIQTMRNLTNEYLNLNFVTTPKLTPLHSFFAEKVFILFDSFISVSLLHTMDYSLWIIRWCVLWMRTMDTTSKLFRYRYFAARPFGFKVFNQVGNRRYFQLVEKKCFA